METQKFNYYGLEFDVVNNDDGTVNLVEPAYKHEAAEHIEYSENTDDYIRYLDELAKESVVCKTSENYIPQVATDIVINDEEIKDKNKNKKFQNLVESIKVNCQKIKNYFKDEENIKKIKHGIATAIIITGYMIRLTNVAASTFNTYNSNIIDQLSNQALNDSHTIEHQLDESFFPDFDTDSLFSTISDNNSEEQDNNENYTSILRESLKNLNTIETENLDESQDFQIGNTQEDKSFTSTVQSNSHDNITDTSNVSEPSDNEIFEKILSLEHQIAVIKNNLELSSDNLHNVEKKFEMAQNAYDSFDFDSVALTEDIIDSMNQIELDSFINNLNEGSRIITDLENVQNELNEAINTHTKNVEEFQELASEHSKLVEKLHELTITNDTIFSQETTVKTNDVDVNSIEQSEQFVAVDSSESIDISDTEQDLSDNTIENDAHESSENKKLTKAEKNQKKKDVEQNKLKEKISDINNQFKDIRKNLTESFNRVNQAGAKLQLAQNNYDNFDFDSINLTEDDINSMNLVEINIYRNQVQKSIKVITDLENARKEFDNAVKTYKKYVKENNKKFKNLSSSLNKLKKRASRIVDDTKKIEPTQDSNSLTSEINIKNVSNKVEVNSVHQSEQSVSSDSFESINISNSERTYTSKEIENLISEQANANPGDIITRNDGSTVILTEGDINAAKIVMNEREKSSNEFLGWEVLSSTYGIQQFQIGSKSDNIEVFTDSMDGQTPENSDLPEKNKEPIIHNKKKREQDDISETFGKNILDFFDFQNNPDLLELYHHELNNISEDDKERKNHILVNLLMKSVGETAIWGKEAEVDIESVKTSRFLSASSIVAEVAVILSKGESPRLKDGDKKIEINSIEKLREYIDSNPERVKKTVGGWFDVEDKIESAISLDFNNSQNIPQSQLNQNDNNYEEALSTHVDILDSLINEEQEQKINNSIDLSKVLIFDTETTGFTAGEDELLQISIIDGNGNTLFNKYIKPQHKESWKEAEAINGISPEMVKDESIIDEYLPELQEFINNADMLMSYNGKFDVKFLKAAGISIPEDKPHLDVMKSAASITKIPERENDTRSIDGYHYPKLVNAAEAINYKYDAHNSLNDSLATLAVAKHIYGNNLEHLTQNDVEKYTIDKDEIDATKTSSFDENLTDSLEIDEFDNENDILNQFNNELEQEENLFNMSEETFDEDLSDSVENVFSEDDLEKISQIKQNYFEDTNFENMPKNVIDFLYTAEHLATPEQYEEYYKKWFRFKNYSFTNDSQDPSKINIVENGKTVVTQFDSSEQNKINFANRILMEKSKDGLSGDMYTPTPEDVKKQGIGLIHDSLLKTLQACTSREINDKNYKEAISKYPTNNITFSKEIVSQEAYNSVDIDQIYEFANDPYKPGIKIPNFSIMIPVGDGTYSGILAENFTYLGKTDENKPLGEQGSEQTVSLSDNGKYVLLQKILEDGIPKNVIIDANLYESQIKRAIEFKEKYAKALSDSERIEAIYDYNDSKNLPKREKRENTAKWFYHNFAIECAKEENEHNIDYIAQRLYNSLPLEEKKKLQEDEKNTYYNMVKGAFDLKSDVDATYNILCDVMFANPVLNCMAKQIGFAGSTIFNYAIGLSATAFETIKSIAKVSVNGVSDGLKYSALGAGYGFAKLFGDKIQRIAEKVSGKEYEKFSEKIKGITNSISLNKKESYKECFSNIRKAFKYFSPSNTKIIDNFLNEDRHIFKNTKERLQNIFNDVQKQKEELGKNPKTFTDLSNSLLSSSTVDYIPEGNRVDPSIKAKVGDVINIVIPYMEGKKTKFMPATNLKIMSASKELNEISFVDESKNTVYRIPLDDFIKSQQRQEQRIKRENHNNKIDNQRKQERDWSNSR